MPGAIRIKNRKVKRRRHLMRIDAFDDIDHLDSSVMDEEHEGYLSEILDTAEALENLRGCLLEGHDDRNCWQSTQFNSPSEHLLSDHTSIDVLILDQELKNVLNNLETLGVLDDDYSSKSPANETDEGEKVVDTTHGVLSTIDHWNENYVVHSTKEDQCANDEDDWDVLSATDSVWTVETVEEDYQVPKIRLDGGARSDIFTVDCSTCTSNRSIEIFHVKSTAMPCTTLKSNGASELERKPVVNVLILESSRIWGSFQDAIKNLG
jgi:hypothetical protein